MEVKRNSIKREPTLSEINVTPMVDIMLVLLIVFMVSAPMMRHESEISLPKASSSNIGSKSEAQITLSINRKKVIKLGKNVVDKKDLIKTLKKTLSEKNNLKIFVEADEKVPYGFIAIIISNIKKAGFNKIGLVTTP